MESIDLRLSAQIGDIVLKHDRVDWRRRHSVEHYGREAVYRRIGYSTGGLQAVEKCEHVIVEICKRRSVQIEDVDVFEAQPLHAAGQRPFHQLDGKAPHHLTIEEVAADLCCEHKLAGI